MHKKVKFAVLIVLSVLLLGCTVYADGSHNIYVSVNGSDENDGTIECPFKTLETARSMARSKRKDGFIGEINVYLRGGEYYLDKSFILNELDSNTVYSAYNGENAVLKGSILLDNSKFREITDNEALSHFPNAETAENIKMYNLNPHKLKLKNINYRGNYNPSWIKRTGNPQELIINGEKLHTARWPNEGFADIREVIDSGVYSSEEESKGFTFKTGYDGIKHWDKAKNAMIYGLFANGWADQTVKINSVDWKTRSLTTKEPSLYTVKQGGKYYIFNLLEELDNPKEYYIDSDKGILYLYLSDTFNSDKIELTKLEYPLLKITDAENVLFENIRFENSNGNGAVINNCKNVVLNKCILKNLGACAVTISNSYDCGVNCSDIDSVFGGVSISCGDMDSLRPGNCYVTNTKITNYQNVTYQSAIGLSGVGNRAANNEISGSDHLAIQFYGNEHVIEYNNIHDVLKCTTDAGVIYCGSTWTSRGNIVRYNYIHNISNSMKTGSPLIALYFDDGFCSADVYGNIIENFPGIGIYVSGRDFNVYNNLIINSSERAIYARQRFSDSADLSTLRGYQLLLKSPYRSELWKERYPKLYTILDENPLKPLGNSIYNNLSIGSGIFNFEDVVIENGVKTEPNLQTQNAEMDENYQLNPSSEVFNTLEGFENINFQQIGIIN